MMRLNEQRSIDWGQRTKSVACRDPVPAFLGFLCRDGNGAAHLQFECRGSYASALAVPVPQSQSKSISM